MVSAVVRRQSNILDGGKVVEDFQWLLFVTLCRTRHHQAFGVYNSDFDVSVKVPLESTWIDMILFFPFPASPSANFLDKK